MWAIISECFAIDGADMGFGAIGLVMLTVVLIFYLKMVDARARGWSHKSQVESIIEKADIFESVADDKSALKIIESGLLEYPDNPHLMDRKQILLRRLDSSSSE
ncbi:hypothetical protein [Reinekea sp. G2M2-21]|uniref:hypothetical protein n=1 Tax=Reinekea sp. G2M2-21 TaxID=2788942 RepID=UPI0018AC7065|nr:hypothetical protein [Reinekea sp. G2M2-21]